MGTAIGNGTGIPFQDKRNEDIPEVCYIITELDEFCVQEIDGSNNGRMIPELCIPTPVPLSLFGVAGEAVSGFSLRDLGEPTESSDFSRASESLSPVIEVINSEGEVYQLLSSDINNETLKKLSGEGGALGVTTWFDQGGDPENLRALVNKEEPLEGLPILFEKGNLVMENGKPAVKFPPGAQLRAIGLSRPLKTPLVLYNIMRMPLALVKIASAFLYLAGKGENQPVLLYERSDLFSTTILEPIMLQNDKLVDQEENQLYLPNGSDALSLYQMSNTLTVPQDFIIGSIEIELYMSEFILYNAKDANQSLVYNNLYNYYGIGKEPIKEQPIKEQPIKEI
tara:strand:- start:1548 stop:2564 length:1017 start_codon:yes stop_codon:yes gene_type:complete